MSSSLLVDDSDPHVQYQPGWIWDQGVAEVDATRHGASTPGLRAWLSFTGTGVRVIGTLGSSDTYGQPITTYSVDGKVVSTYSAPLMPSGETQFNVTFFSARNLSPGDHIVLINNTGGASPSTFWLDYFLIDNTPSTSGGATTPAAQTIDPEPTTKTETNSSGTVIVSTVTAAPTGASQAPAPNTNISTHKSNVGVIVGATVAGVAALAIFALALFCLRRRRRRDAAKVIPFACAPNSQNQFAPYTLPGSFSPQPTMRYSTTNTEAISISPASNYGQRAFAAPPSEIGPESVVSQSASETPSASTGSALLAPARHPPSPTSPTMPPLMSATPSTPNISQTTEKTRSTVYPSTPSLRYAPSSPNAVPISPALSSASSTPLMSPLPSSAPAAAVLPPGAWHAPPGAHPRAHAILRSLFSRGPRSSAGSVVAAPPISAATHDVDSGLRLYDEVVHPPPYTQD
ncbi:hypothetical protein BC628DRAFT_370362 [Trametes gibbosa]|nr:hypothetical protein BC628DRAFT_370362 [Trametes gibbosa]